MKRSLHILILLLFAFGSSSTVNKTNQMPDTRSVVKALYLYTFATLVEWPQEMRSGDFEIGVLGDRTGVYDELTKKYSGKSIGSQTITVKNYTSAESFNKCHILFVSPNKSSDINTVVEKTKKANTLLVTEKRGGLNEGSVINFIVDGNQQKYEINKSNAKKHKLVIADKLSNLAARVVK